MADPVTVAEFRGCVIVVVVVAAAAVVVVVVVAVVVVGVTTEAAGETVFMTELTLLDWLDITILD